MFPMLADLLADPALRKTLAEVVPVIISLVVIEGLLSVDNALAIAALARHLPQKEKTLALRLGILGAYGFRVVALFAASLIIRNPWLKIAGAAYLIYLMAAHFRVVSVVHGPVGDEDGAAGKPAVKPDPSRGFWPTVLSIQLMDLSLSVDNVVAAVAMSPKFWVVCTGVFIGILALMFLAGLAMRMIERFPTLEDVAFVLIGYVGALLLFEMATHRDIGAGGKFVGIAIILAVGILYARSEGLRRVLGPVLRALRWPLRLYAGAVGAVFLPFRWVFNRLFRARPSPLETTGVKTDVTDPAPSTVDAH